MTLARIDAALCIDGDGGHDAQDVPGGSCAQLSTRWRTRGPTDRQLTPSECGAKGQEEDCLQSHTVCRVSCPLGSAQCPTQAHSGSGLPNVASARVASRMRESCAARESLERLRGVASVCRNLSPSRSNVAGCPAVCHNLRAMRGAPQRLSHVYFARWRRSSRLRACSAMRRGTAGHRHISHTPGAGSRAR